jgi:hypothetical protein
MKKYKLTWKDLSLNDFKVYFFSLFKAFIPKSKIKNLDELEEFIQTSLPGYLKLHFIVTSKQEWEPDMFYILIMMSL